MKQPEAVMINMSLQDVNGDSFYIQQNRDVSELQVNVPELVAFIAENLIHQAGYGDHVIVAISQEQYAALMEMSSKCTQ